jgi:hypothetical protein
MPWVGTPAASQEPRPHGCCASAFPVGRAGRLLHDGAISGLFIPFTGVPACDLPVYASPGTLPYPTQDSVPDCWLGFVRVVISDDWTFCACKAQLPHHRTYGARIRRFGRLSQGATRTPTGASAPGVPVVSSSQASDLPANASPDAIGPLHPRRQRLSTVRTFPPIAGGTMPSADFCRAVREDYSPLSPEPGHPADLPR